MLWLRVLLLSCTDIFTARKRSLRSFCFHRCLSVHRGMVSATPPPSGRHPPGRHSHCPVHAGIHTPSVHAGVRSTSGQYASQWNAFLSQMESASTLILKILYQYLVPLKNLLLLRLMCIHDHYIVSSNPWKWAGFLNQHLIDKQKNVYARGYCTVTLWLL